MRTGGHQSLSWALPSEAHSGIWPKVTSQTRTCGCPDTLPQFPLRATLRPQGHGAQSPPTQGLGFREGKEGTHDPSGACPGGPKPLERAEETLGALLQPAAQPRGLRAGADVEGWLTPLHPLCSSD